MKVVILVLTIICMRSLASILVDLSQTSSGCLMFMFSLAHGSSLISFDPDSMQRSIYRHVYLLILR